MDKFNDIESFSHGYKQFLNACKTERETAAKAAEMAKAAGFVPLDTVQALHPGYRQKEPKIRHAPALRPYGRAKA